MTVKEAMLKKYRAHVELPTVEALQKYQDKPSEYVTITYALDHNKIPNNQSDIRLFISPRLSKDRITGKYKEKCILYSYFPWSGLRDMTTAEIAEYNQIRADQQAYFKKKYSTPNPTHDNTENQSMSHNVPPVQQERTNHSNPDIDMDINNTESNRTIRDYLTNEYIEQLGTLKYREITERE